MCGFRFIFRPFHPRSYGIHYENYQYTHFSLFCCVLFVFNKRKREKTRVLIISKARVLKILIKPSGRLFSSLRLPCLRICHVCSSSAAHITLNFAEACSPQASFLPPLRMKDNICSEISRQGLVLGRR